MTSVQNNAIAVLLGCFIVGYLSNLGEFAAAKQTNFEVDNIPVGDYDSYSEDEESPDQIRKPLSTMMPYFEERNKTVLSKVESKVKLDCPAKNYNESQHQILWFKDGIPIANGKQSLSNSYQLDNDFSLTIEKVDEKSQGDYYCSVFPQNVSRHIHLKFPEADLNSEPMLQARVPTMLTVILIEKAVKAIIFSKLV